MPASLCAWKKGRVSVYHPIRKVKVTDVPCHVYLYASKSNRGVGIQLCASVTVVLLEVRFQLQNSFDVSTSKASPKDCGEEATWKPFFFCTGLKPSSLVI